LIEASFFAQDNLYISGMLRLKRLWADLQVLANAQMKESGIITFS